MYDENKMPLTPDPAAAAPPPAPGGGAAPAAQTRGVNHQTTRHTVRRSAHM